jgi:hypothetical protein
MSNSKSVKVAAPSSAREWAKANVENIAGLPEGYTVGNRGRLHPAVIKAYNKAHPRAKYVTAAFVETVTVKGTRTLDSGRKVPFSQAVNVSEARAALVKAGQPVGKRGRIAQSLLVSFALGEVTPSE